MNKNIFLIFVSVIGFLWPGAFPKVSAGEAEEVQGLLSQPDKRIEIYSGDQPQDINQLVQKILSKPLTVEDAVQVSLLNNPQTQATLRELTISRADRLQGRLLPNPELEASIHNRRLHETGENVHDYELRLLQDVNSLIFYPFKWRQTGAQYDEAKMHVADQLLSEVSEVKKAYFRLQSLQQRKVMLTTILQTVEAATELAKRQRGAGTLNALDLANQETLVHETRLSLARTESQVTSGREELNRLLGFSKDESSWTIPDRLSKPEDKDPDLGELESLALSKRRDLAAARYELKSLDRQVTLNFLDIVPSIRAGVLVEQEEGDQFIGPAGQIEIPLTDWNQAGIKRARAKRSQGRSRLQALEAQTRTEVRTLFQRLATARRAVTTYEENILPLRMKAVEESQKHYNYMLLGVYQLLQAKQNEITAFQNYIESLEEYWLTRTDLERAIGESLPVLRPQPETPERQEVSPESPAKPIPKDHHHNGGE